MNGPLNRPRYMSGRGRLRAKGSGVPSRSPRSRPPTGIECCRSLERAGVVASTLTSGWRRSSPHVRLSGLLERAHGSCEVALAHNREGVDLAVPVWHVEANTPLTEHDVSDCLPLVPHNLARPVLGQLGREFVPRGP